MCGFASLTWACFWCCLPQGRGCRWGDQLLCAGSCFLLGCGSFFCWFHCGCIPCVGGSVLLQGSFKSLVFLAGHAGTSQVPDRHTCICGSQGSFKSLVEMLQGSFKSLGALVGVRWLPLHVHPVALGFPISVLHAVTPVRALGLSADWCHCLACLVQCVLPGQAGHLTHCVG